MEDIAIEDLDSMLALLISPLFLMDQAYLASFSSDIHKKAGHSAIMALPALVAALAIIGVTASEAASKLDLSAVVPCR